MAMRFNHTPNSTTSTVTSVNYNNEEVNVINLDGTQVWGRECTVYFNTKNCTWDIGSSISAYYGDTLFCNIVLGEPDTGVFLGCTGYDQTGTSLSDARWVALKPRTTTGKEPDDGLYINPTRRSKNYYYVWNKARSSTYTITSLVELPATYLDSSYVEQHPLPPLHTVYIVRIPKFLYNPLTEQEELTQVLTPFDGVETTLGNNQEYTIHGTCMITPPIITYPSIKIEAGLGIKEAYTSTDATGEVKHQGAILVDTTTYAPTDVAYYAQNTGTVYGFVVLDAHYDVPANSGWVLVDGTANEEDAVYRVGSKTTSEVTQTFGTINASIEQYECYIELPEHIASMSVSTDGIHYTTYTEDDNFTVDDQSTIYWYVTPEEHYHAVSNCGQAAVPCVAIASTDTVVNSNKTYYTKSAEADGVPGYQVDADGYTYGILTIADIEAVPLSLRNPAELGWYELIIQGSNPVANSTVVNCADLTLPTDASVQPVVAIDTFTITYRLLEAYPDTWVTLVEHDVPYGTYLLGQSSFPITYYSYTKINPETEVWDDPVPASGISLTQISPHTNYTETVHTINSTVNGSGNYANEYAMFKFSRDGIRALGDMTVTADYWLYYNVRGRNSTSNNDYTKYKATSSASYETITPNTYAWRQVGTLSYSTGVGLEPHSVFALTGSFQFHQASDAYDYGYGYSTTGIRTIDVPITLHTYDYDGNATHALIRANIGDHARATNFTPSDSLRWFEIGTVLTWETTDSNYAFDANGSQTISMTVQSSYKFTSYTQTAYYKKLNVTYANCHRYIDNSGSGDVSGAANGWWTQDRVTIIAQADTGFSGNTGWSFGSGSRTSWEIGDFYTNTFTLPYTGTVSPRYYTVNLWQGLTNCSFTEAPPSTREYYDANGNYWVDRQQYPSGYQFELMVSNANYAFSYAGDASAHYTLPSSPGIFTVSATHGKACITLEGCTGYVTYGAGSAEVQITSGQVVWCSLTGAGNRVSVRAVADTGWSFGGSNTQDFISRSGTVPFVDTISPEYCQITMTCANVSSYEIWNSGEGGSGSTLYPPGNTNTISIILRLHSTVTVFPCTDYAYSYVFDQQSGTNAYPITVTGPAAYNCSPTYGRIDYSNIPLAIFDSIYTVVTPTLAQPSGAVNTILLYYGWFPLDKAPYTIVFHPNGGWHYVTNPGTDDDTYAISNITPPYTLPAAVIPGYIEVKNNTSLCTAYMGRDKTDLSHPISSDTYTIVPRDFVYFLVANQGYNWAEDGTMSIRPAASGQYYSRSTPGLLTQTAPYYHEFDLILTNCVATELLYDPDGSGFYTDCMPPSGQVISEGTHIYWFLIDSRTSGDPHYTWDQVRVQVTVRANTGYYWTSNPSAENQTQFIDEIVDVHMPIMAIAPEYVGLTDPVGIHCDSIYIDHRLASTYLDSDVRRYVVSGSAEIIYNAAFGYAFSAQGATSKAVLVSGPGDYSSNSPTYGRLYVGCTECGAYLTGYGDITNNGRWLPLTGTPYSVTYTANQDWAFSAISWQTGSNASPVTEKTIPVSSLPASISERPTWYEATISCSHCTAKIGTHNVTNTTYWYNGAQTVEFTANAMYAYDNSGYTTDSITINSPGTKRNEPTFGRYNLSLTHCERTSGTENGTYWQLGSTKNTVVQASQYYWFTSGSNPTSSTTISATVPGTAVGDPQYISARGITGTYCTPYIVGHIDTPVLAYSGNAYRIGSTIVWEVENSYYAWDYTGTTTSAPVELTPGGNFNNTPTHERAASITSVNCSANKDASTWYPSNNRTITWTASEGYHFGSSNSNTTSSTTLVAGGTHSATATRNTYSITFNGPTYGYWVDESDDVRSSGTTRTAYYGDKIVTDPQHSKVTCYTWDTKNNSSPTIRWTMSVAQAERTAQYTYSIPYITHQDDIASVTANITFAATDSRTVNKYTVTWYYKTSYNNVTNSIWTSATTTYYYGDTIGTTTPYLGAVPSPSYLYESSSEAASSNRYRFVTWGYPYGSTVTGDTSVYAEYQKQFKAKVTGTRCSIKINNTTRASGYETWYDYKSESGDYSMVVVWTANQYCAYNSDGTGTSNTQNINAPGTYDYSFDYINVTVNAGTHCASKTKSTGWHAYNTTCTWTASTGYAFDYTGTQTKSKNFTTPGGTYGGDINAKFVKFEITYTNCTATEDSQPNSYYELGLSSPSYFYVDARANTGWSFGGSNTQDLYSDFYGNAIPYPTAPFSATISPDYFYLTFSGTNCKPVKQGTNIVLTSGLYDTAQTFMWVADTNYAFTNSGGTAYPGGNYISTSASPNTYSQTAGYGKYTVSKTNCTANVSTGWYEVTNSKTTTFTASSGWYWYENSQYKTSVTRSAAVPGSVTGNPGYCEISLEGTHCTAKVNGSAVTLPWTGKPAAGGTVTFTADSGWAYNYSGDTEDSWTITGPGTIQGSPDCGRLTITGLQNCAVDGDPGAGYYSVSSNPLTVTIKANANYSFGGSSYQDTITREVSVPATISNVSPGYCKISVYAGNCTITVDGTEREYSWTGMAEIGKKVICTADANYSYNAAGTQSTYEETITGTGSYGEYPGYGYWNITYTNCTRQSGNTNGWYAIDTQLIATAKANSGWSFGGSSTQDTEATPGMSGGNYAYPPFAYTFSPDYVSATPKGSNCTIRQGSTSGSILTTNTAYIVYKGTKFYWMPSTNYSYAAGATSSTTTYKTVTINSPGTYDYSPDYAKLASVSCTRCTCDHNNSTYYTIGETITFTANTNCAFNSSGTSTTDTSKSVSAGGRPSASADWVHVTALNGTHCSTASTTGWYQYGVDISWIADTGYAFDNYNTTAWDTEAVPGANSCEAEYLRYYVITFTDPTYGGWQESEMGPAYHFDKLAKSGQVVTCYQGNSSTVRWINTVDKATDTNQWTYTTPTIGTVPSSVTGAHTISASDSRTENKYNVTFTNGTYGTWDSTTAINATYSTSISKSGMVVTVGSTSRTYSLPSNTAQYTYTTTINNASGTVGTGKSITTTDVRTTNKYAVSITKGTGISSVYLSSTSDTATSGDNSGTQYNYGTKVRAYAVLADHYDVPADSTWTLVSGTANATGAKYKIGEVTVSGAHNFGTINAAIETYTLSVTKGTGIARIYYKVNGASNYSSTTSNLSVSVNDQSTYYYYAVADDYHTVNSDCGTSSSPKSGTVNCANVSKSVSTTAKTYPLRYEYDHGSVTWYSDANRTNTITGAAYGTTIYYSKTPSTGYINSGAATGSVVLNTSNFEIVEYSGTMTAVMDFGSATRISGTISQGTLPTGVASITCYRKAWDASTYSVYTGSTIYYGDKFYWVAAASTEYNTPSVTYGSSSNVYTWTGSNGGSITSVSASGLSAGSRKSFTITLAKASSHNYFDWKNSSTTVTSMTAYYGDIISTSGNTVTCKKWDATSTNRWQVTATKYSNTTQYSYSTPTVTGGTINSVTAAATITGSNNRTTNQYTITWKYQDAFNSWNTDTTAVYYYGDTPGTTTPQSGSVPSPETVTKADNSMRNVPLSWDSLATVTGNRTITMGYKTQWNVTSVSGTRCTAYADSSHNTAMTTGWKDNDDPIYWVADTNCAFYESSGTYVTEVVDWIDSNGSWSRTAPLVHVTGGTGTNCTMTSSTGWYQYGEDIEWSANTGYCFDQSDNAVTAYTDAVPGSQTGPTTYKKRFTLTITVDTASHFSAYTVKRGTETLSNGAYIYYGDVLTRSATAASTTYGSWNITSVTAPTFTTTGDATTGNLTVTNKDSNTGTLYYNTSNAAGGTAIASSIAYNGSATKTGLSFNTTYYISTGVSRSRPAYNYSVSSAISGGYSSSVTGNCTVAFTSTRIDPTTNTGTVYSSTVAAKTAARNSYTITWSYQDSYEHWTSTTTTVAYGNTPSAPVTPETVTSGNSRNVPGSWSPSITSCTGDKTYTMGYTRQYNATSYNGTRCSTSAATGWYNSGTSVSWSASSNCAFNSTGTQTTTTTTITSGGEQTCTAGYVNATGFSGTHCSTTASTGWRAYGASISWTADTAYAFDYTNTTTKTTGAVAGTNYCSAPYVKQYTLTISVTNSGYASSYSVSRTSSPYEGAATGTLSNNATIYYGDVLTGSSTAKSQSSTTWGEYGTVTAPTVTSTGDATSGNITVTNKDSATCTLYYNTTNSTSGGTSLGNAAANGALSTSGLSFGTTYYCYASKTVSRSGTYYTYSKSSSNYTGTNGVTGDVTASFSFSRTTNNTSSTTTGYSPTTSHTTAARNQYTITWSYLTAYDNTWTPAAGQSGAKTTTYYYGETPSRTDPGNVTNTAGTSRMRSDSWNSLAVVTGNRTITRQYTKQHYIDFTGTRCTPYQSSSYSGTTYADGWYNNSDTAFTIYWKANSNCAFTNAGTDAATKTTSTCTPNQARTPSASADWIYVTISSSNCTANKSTGWNSYNATCTWTANSSYAFDYSGTSTAYTTLTTPGGNYSKTANYGHYVLSLSHCHRKSGTADGYEVVNASSSAYSTVVEADDGWAFDANGTTEKTISAACPGTASASATYFYLTITSGTGCSANKSSGWYNAAQTITWTRSSGYAFDSSGTTTSSRTTSAAPGEYTKAASHGYYTLSLTNCARSSGNAAGWYALGSTPSTTVQANEGWSFNGSSRDTKSIGGSAVPCTASASPSYFYITVGATNCTANASSGYYTSSTKPSSITWTPNQYYSFESGTTQKSYTVSSISNAPAQYSYAPAYVRAYAIATGAYNASVNRNNSTYYAENTVVTWTALSSYSYGGSSTGDTTTNNNTVITAGANIMAPNPGYVKCTLTGTRCSPSPASGSIIAVGSNKITWTASDGYSFAAGTDRTATAYSNVALGTTSYSKSADYKNITVSGTNCSADTASGYRHLGDTITWTASSGTNYKYSFSNSSATSPSTTSTETITTSTTSYNRTASYIYYNVTISPATNCTANYSSGYILNGTTVTFTAPANTDGTVHYAFSTSDHSKHTTTGKVSSAGQTISSGDYYTWYYITVSANTNSSVTSNGTGYYRSGTSNTSTWTVSDSAKYTFNSNHTAGATSTTTWTADSKKTISAKTVYDRYYTVSFSDGSGGGTWSTASAWVPYGTTWSTNGTTVTLSGSNGSSTYTKAEATGYTSSYSITPTSGTVTSDKIIYGSTSFTLKSYTYSTGTLPTGFTACTCYRVSSPHAEASTGVVANGGTIYHFDTLKFTYTLSTPYKIVNNTYYDDSHTLTVTGNVTGVTATGLSCEVKSFTLTRNVYNSSYGSAYTVSRTSSPYQGAATGTISFNSQNKATVYYGDKFSVTCTAKSDTYGAWDCSSLTAPSLSSTGAAMAPNITVTNSNSVSAEIFVNNQAAVRGADIPYTMSGNESQYLTYQSSNYINWGNTVYVCFHKQAQRSYWTYSGFSEWYGDYNSTNGVTGNCSVAFIFDESGPYTDTQEVYSSWTSQVVANRNSYTITFNKPTYGSWGSATKTAYHGDTLSVSGNTVSCTGNTTWSNTLTANSTTTQYTYSASITNSSTVAGTVTGAKTVTTTSARYTRSYAVNCSATGAPSGTEFKVSTQNVWNAGASGAGAYAASGTTYQYGTTVYGWIMLPTGYEVTTSGWTKDTTWPNGNAWVSTAKTVTGTTNFTATVAQASTSTTLHIYSPYMIDEYSSSGSFTLNYLGTTNNGYFHYSLPNANGDDVLYVGPDYLWLRDQTFHVYYSGAYVEGFIYKEGTSSMPDWDSVGYDGITYTGTGSWTIDDYFNGASNGAIRLF